jgi:hypothetical protein
MAGWDASFQQKNRSALHFPAIKKEVVSNLRIFPLSCQGSNLDSSEPKSDVLPITPQDKAGAKINKK